MYDEAMAEGVGYCRTANMSHKDFCLVTWEKFMKYWLWGSYLIIKSTPRDLGDRPLKEIGYKWNYRKVQGFIATEGFVITETSNNHLYLQINSVVMTYLTYGGYSLRCNPVEVLKEIIVYSISSLSNNEVNIEIF